jgi:hypothetical protein
MRFVWLVFLMGCGSVNAKSDASTTGDSAGDGASIDSPSGCMVHDTVDSCGASCQKCTVNNDREVAACDGTTCGFTCVGGAPKCNDGTCSRLVWNFDDGSLGGAVPVAPNGLQLTVSAFNGNPALAMQVTSLVEVSFKLPLCVTGNADLHGKTATAQVFFDGGDPNGQQYYVQGSIPSPMNGAFLTQQAIQAKVFQTWTGQVNLSNFAGAATDLTFQAGTLGAQFSGTIYFDDITIQ